MTKKVAIIGERFGRVRDAFIARGHDAVSCDIVASEVDGPHIQADARSVDWSGYDIIIAHPPCTYLCNSGVRWLTTDPSRWTLMREAAEFFVWCLSLRPAIGVAVENPIMHKHAVEIVGRRQDQIIQPWQFGHGETKATCLWLAGLPKLRHTSIVAGREQRVHRMAPSPSRSMERSKTYQGIADAMAEQWGSL